MKKGKGKVSAYMEALETVRAGNLSGAVKHLETHPGSCRDLFLQHDRIMSYLRKQLPLPASAAQNVWGLESYGPLPEWKPMTTLIIFGKAGLGKTSLAKCLIPTPLFCRHMDKLKEFRVGTHGGIIFDDMSFQHIHNQGQIAIVDCFDDTQIHIRYTYVDIPAGTKRIVTTNRLPHEILLTHERNIYRRVTMWEFKSVQEIILLEYEEKDIFN